MASFQTETREFKTAGGTRFFYTVYSDTDREITTKSITRNFGGKFETRKELDLADGKGKKSPSSKLAS